MGTEEEGGCGGAAAVTAAASHRIYVGGLGGNVTAEDLKNTFSSPQLGSVESVEIVRTKGRSFAYLDFVPSSDKGLAKLFSTYNGCMWKGARLRLEKAKEHYILRLRREWEEDAKLSIDSNSFDGDAVVNMPSLEKPVKAHNLENTQLRIFFPKLRKVKPVPLKGTGKHKYSFPRVEVPPLPIHLCDCEEHSGSSDAANKSFHREDENDGINEEELSMMSSVMNKLFERENISETACTKVGFTMEAFVSRNSVDDIQVDQERDQISDEDNLIMNMVDGSNSGITTADAWEQNAISGNQEPSRSRSLQRIHKNQGKATVLSKKKRKAAQDFDTIPDQVAEPGTGVLQPSYHHMCPKKSIRRDLVSEGENSFRISDILQSNDTGGEMQSKPDSSTLLNCKDPPSQSSQIKVVNESTETICGTPNAGIDKGREGNSFLNRSSWMQLVGSNSSFSISQILPGLNLEKQEIPQFNVTDSSTSTKRRQDFMKTDKSDFITDVSKSQPVVDIPKFSLADSKTNHASQNQLDSKQPIQAKRTSMGDRGMPETFTFKRSAASMKEWKKAKAAVSGSQKKRVKKK
ncbi:unnamed protein product [Coffea canephora]|uniref:RRM domain-containing protein n=1 Tax=Coffea canephora TaxID=49390 RepID=A0A068V0U5_COFCA|nr:unnamed protein product [Coffea canephora]